jgi:hypothetical protein
VSLRSGVHIPNPDQDKWSQDDGAAEFWAAPRGYAVYVPH